MWFNQIKHTLKLNKKVLKFNELKLELRKSINKLKKTNYENYFKYAYPLNVLGPIYWPELREISWMIRTLF